MRGVRSWFVACPLLLMVAGCAEFDGEVYPQVVSGQDVELREVLPEGYFVIGEVSSEDEAVGWCPPRRRLRRRMKREAAYNGGELLIGMTCEEWETVEVDWEGDLEETCHLECRADVARSDQHDG